MTRAAWARLGAAVVFFVNGAVFASWGSRIPAISSGLHMGPGQLAVAVFGLSVGAVVGLPLSGVLVSRFGSIVVVRVSLVGYAAALVAVATAPHVAVLTLALVGLGVGNGMVDVAMNAAAVHVERHYPRQIMAAFHAQFSFGGLAGAMAGAGAQAAGVPVAVHLPLVALVLAALGWAASFGLLPDVPERRPAGKPGAGGALRRDRRLLALGLLVFSSLLCEGTVYDWSAIHLRDDLGADPATAALGFASFALCMACCRLVADRIADRVGAVAYVRGCGLLATGGLTVTLLGSSPAIGIVGFGLLGLALAGVVPTLFSAAARGHGEPAPAIALVSTIGYLGFLAGPVLIGAIAHAASLPLALAMLVVLTLTILAGAGTLRTGADGAHGARQTCATGDRGAPADRQG